MIKTAPGDHRFLGATVVDDGVNFALFSRHAKKVQLLLFAPHQPHPSQTINLHPKRNKTGDVWHILVHHLPPQTRYAYRLNGPSGYGHKFDPRKVLFDPYSRGLDRTFYRREDCGDNNDSLLTSLRSIVVPHEDFDWQGTAKPLHHPQDLIIYELHPKGFTASPTADLDTLGFFPRLKEKLPYLQDLGINAIELLPVHTFDDDQWQTTQWGQQLVNYWGYSTLSFFALENSYFSDPADPASHLREFKEFVRACHSQNIAVIMDVVFNHTTEGDHGGPHLSYRGIDNHEYYLNYQSDKRFYLDYTGCGNTFNVNNPPVTRLILDSLEYFASECHIDGFRFDLAGAFFYDKDGNLSGQSNLLHKIERSNILKSCYLIAEPWSAVGHNFAPSFDPDRWLVWNDRFRDDTRKLLNLSEINQPDQFLLNFANPDGNSLNFVTCHDGFTLWDLVSFNHKHNEANSYGNQDGTDDNFSHNSGAEGATSMEDVNALRFRKIKNFFTILLLSKGAVMLNMGDEVARSQNGNNNAFNQDTDISYFNWYLAGANFFLYEFVQKLILLRRSLPAIASISQDIDHGLLSLIVNYESDSHLLIIINFNTEPKWLSIDPELNYRQIIDTNNAHPFDIIEYDSAEPLLDATIFIAPQSVKVLIS
ncbi:isoamylase [Microgenomates group bacterium]|nr:isoamylase [Microgenomates group bacterium]